MCGFNLTHCEFYFIKELNTNKSRIISVFFTIFISLFILSSVTILKNSIENEIKNKLFLLNPNTIIYPGHGQKTILKNEMKDNPFLI